MNYIEKSENILHNASNYNPDLKTKVEMAKVYAILALAEAINNKNK